MTSTTQDALQKLCDLDLVIQRKPRSSQSLGQDNSEETYILEVSPLGKAVFKGQ